MKALASALGAATLALSMTAPAGAAQFSLQYSLTLYEGLDYRGASVTIYGDNANLGSTGFADRARSAQVRGVWRLCEGGGFRNRCEVLSANVRDLGAYGLSGRVGSAQNLSFASAAPAPYGSPPRSYSSPAQAYAPPAQTYVAPARPYAAPPQVYSLPEPYAPPPAQAYVAPTQTYAPPPQTYVAPPQAYAPPPAARLAPPPAEPTYVAPYTAAPAYGSSAYDPDAYAPPAVDAPLASPGAFGRGAPMPAPLAPPRTEGTAYQPAPAYRPSYGPGTFGSDPSQGGTTVYFPMPLVRGVDVSAADPRAADDYCRSQGLGGAVYFDQAQRRPGSVDVNGRLVGEGPVLRDVLCRR